MLSYSLIFSQIEENIIISNINITGNKVTKDKIILRELLFNIGDTINIADIDSITIHNRENLENTSLFNFVTITNRVEGNLINVNIDLIERWYIWPMPILEQADRNISSFLHEKDWSRINYGMFLAIENFRGRNESLRFKARFGYKEHYGVGYEIPGIDKKQKHGIYLEASYFRQKELSFKTLNNKLTYYRNFNNYSKYRARFIFNYRYRKDIYNYHLFSVQYNNAIISDTVRKLNPNYFGDANMTFQYINLEYNYTLDKRDIQYYPLSGYYFNASINNKGLFFKETNTTQLNANFRWYKNIVKRINISQKIAGKLSNNYDQEYFIIEGLGYTENIRGYEYYVIDGNSFIVFNNNLKFTLLPKKVFNYPIIPWSQFKKSFIAIYLNAYLDLGYVDNKYTSQTNNMTNSWQYGYGLGIDFVTYYDSVLRIEYSLTKYNQKGIYIHITTAF
jgi:outer membrane protein assembly factor BamA